MIAAELNLWSHTEGTGSEKFVEVFNLRDFAEDVRRKLKALKPSDEKVFESSLTEFQRKVVHLIAEELGFGHVSQGEGTRRRVTVANLREFRAEARAEIEALRRGETKIFVKTLSAMHRKVVHELAAELGMSHISTGKGKERYVSVTLPKETEEIVASERWQAKWKSKVDAVVDHLEAEEKKLQGQEADNDAESEFGEDLPEADRFGRLFHQFASGSHRGQKIFVRSPDLEEFSVAFVEVCSRRSTPARLEAFLKEMFSNVTQIQLDFGTRTTKGLTLQWFQIFVQKAALKAGFSATSLAQALLHEL